MKKNWGRRDNWAAWGEREIWISEIWFKEGKVWSKRIKWESWCDVMEACWTQNWFGERSHDQECGRRTRKLRTQSRIRADWGWEQKIKHFVEYRYCMGIPRQREEKEVLRKGRTRGSKAKEKQTKTINLRNMSREKINKEKNNLKKGFWVSSYDLWLPRFDTIPSYHLPASKSYQ